MLRDNGTAKVNIVPNPAVSSDDAMLRAVQTAAAGDFTVLGEIGRGSDGVIVYLARDAATDRLVALRLQREGSLANEFTLELARQLDNSMPAPESRCFKCGKAIRGWARFCSYCGADLSGAAGGGEAESLAMLEAVKEAVAGDYEVLGQMARSEGGGAVYFARDRQSNRIVALRLQREGSGDEFSVGLTSALKPLAASLGVKPVATQLLGQMVAPPSAAPLPQVPTPPVASAAAVPPPMPHRPPPLPTGGAGLSRRAKGLIATGGLAVLVLAVVMLTLPHSQPATQALGAGRPADTLPATPPPPPPPPPAPAAAPVTQPASRTESPAPVEPTVPRRATVSVNGLPAGADVRVDGHYHRERQLLLPPGVHVFSVTTAGYLPISDTIELRSGETRQWSPSLTPEPHPVAAAKPSPPPVQHAGAEPSAKAQASGAACQQAVDAKQWTQAAESCMAAAVAGNAASQRRLAELYEHGHGVKGSDQDAARWYEAAAGGGDRDAMFITAGNYEHGHGVKRDASTAAQWYAKAGDAGHVLAQITLGEAYEKGHLGLQRDKAKALEWYRKAAAQGNKDAANKVHDLSK